jgi:serine/threonine protein kinase
MRTTAEIDFVSSVYSLQEKLGEGGMGVVYRAIHRLSGRQVALKRVHAREAIGDTAAAIDAATRGARLGLRLSLVHEFQMLASLHHPNIVTVFDFGFNAQQRPFFTMELLPNPQSILDHAAGQSVRAKVALLGQLLQALAYLHRRGIFHRDPRHKPKLWPHAAHSAAGRRLEQACLPAPRGGPSRGRYSPGS